jgi:hypothetical protein
MEKDSKKNTTPDINEDLMMNLMVDGVKKEGLQLPPEPAEKPELQDINTGEFQKEKSGVKEKSKGKRINDAEYEKVFFRKPETNARDGKTVYIRPEFHEKLTRVIQVIGEDKITIYAYLDNLLDYHFQEFAEQITKRYNEKYKPIF